MTITTDNSPEFAQYKEIEQNLQCQIYYAKPYAPWQKGAVENANMLIRQYVPKGFNINTISIQYLAYIQNKINSRPREKLIFKLLLSGKNKLKVLYLFIHRCCSRFNYPGAWFLVSNCKHYKMCLF